MDQWGSKVEGKKICVCLSGWLGTPGHYFLQQKMMPLKFFVHWWENIQKKKYWKQLKAIRSDHGTEFENSKFAQYCDYHGVDHNFSAPRTPQQNGVVERKNRTLQEMARTMMITSKITNQFLAEAINTACYTINRCMTRPLLEKTPYELLKGRKPNISHLRVFGCKCFIHNNGKICLENLMPGVTTESFLDILHIVKLIGYLTKEPCV